jgi:hypothetical protein
VDILEKILGIYTVSIYREGSRLLKIKSLGLLVQAMKGTRKVALMYYFSVVSFIIVTAGIFTIANQCIHQYQQTGGVYWDALTISGSVLTTVGIFSTLWLLSEKRWIHIFQLNQYIGKLMPAPLAAPDLQQSGTKSDDLMMLLDEIIDKRLNEILKKYEEKVQPVAYPDTPRESPQEARKFGTA